MREATVTAIIQMRKLMVKTLSSVPRVSVNEGREVGPLYDPCDSLLLPDSRGRSEIAVLIPPPHPCQGSAIYITVAPTPGQIKQPAVQLARVCQPKYGAIPLL